MPFVTFGVKLVQRLLGKYEKFTYENLDQEKNLCEPSALGGRTEIMKNKNIHRQDNQRILQTIT